MKIFAALTCYVRDNGGTVKAVSKVAALSLVLLRRSGVRGLIGEFRQTLSARNEQAESLRRRKTLLRAADSKRIVVLSTSHVWFVANMLIRVLREAGFEPELIMSRPISGYRKDLHIVLCPQMFPRLPRHMIAFQLEQTASTRWFDERYLRILRNSLAVFDYSTANIKFLTDAGIPYSQIFYLPISMIPSYREMVMTSQTNTIPADAEAPEVLFYGDVNNTRRRHILNELQKYFSVTIIHNLFGESLYRKLIKSRVVINLHYYDDALLETTRIYECLSLGIPVVSENSVDAADYPELESIVRFVDVGDITGMVAALNDVLMGGGDDSGFRQKLVQLSQLHADRVSFYVKRFLLASEMIDLDGFTKNLEYKTALSTGKVCLSLPETVDRRQTFLRQGLKEFKPFDGLRHFEGWVGCGLSYKFLISLARRERLPRILICEDDAVLSQAGQRKLSVIESYLSGCTDAWDVFVGVIAHVDKDVAVEKVVNYKGLNFLHINKMMSAVLNIYNSTVYDSILAWDESDRDRKHNTIDRYLERIEGLRVVTVVPFIVGHDEGVKSTLWGFDNEKYREMISESETLLLEKMRTHREENAVTTRPAIGT